MPIARTLYKAALFLHASPIPAPSARLALHTFPSGESRISGHPRGAVPAVLSGKTAISGESRTSGPTGWAGGARPARHTRISWHSSGAPVLAGQTRHALQQSAKPVTNTQIKTRGSGESPPLKFIAMYAWEKAFTLVKYSQI